MRQGDVQAAPAVQEKVHHVPAELRRRHIEAPVDHRLLGLAREQAVDERRPAVRDRMPDDSILIRRRVHRGPRQFTVENGRKPRLKCRCTRMICNRVGRQGVLIQESDTFRPVAQCDTVTLVRHWCQAKCLQCADAHAAGSRAVEKSRAVRPAKYACARQIDRADSGSAAPSHSSATRESRG